MEDFIFFVQCQDIQSKYNIQPLLSLFPVKMETILLPLTFYKTD